MMKLISKDGLSQEEINEISNDPMSYWNQMKDYMLSPDELATLIVSMEEVLKITLPQESVDLFRKLIALLRQKVVIDNSIPTNDELKRELAAIENPLKNLVDRLNMSFRLNEHFWHQAREHDLYGEDDPMAGTYRHSQNLLKLCEAVKGNIKPTKNKVNVNFVRLVVGKELAREMDRIGIMPTKTQGGKFDTCYQLLLSKIACEVKGTKVAVSVPENTKHIVYEALNTYKSQSMYAPLNLI